VRGNPHAAGAGTVVWSRWCDTRRRKSDPTGNTNFDLNRPPVLDPTDERGEETEPWSNQ
jgi:hypothetical protein